MAYAPTLTPYTDANPCPRVEVYFPSFAPGTVTVTVTRTAESREFKVRGAVRAPVVGSLTRLDFECPFGVQASYKAEMFDANGYSLGFTSTSSIASLNSSRTWLHNPLSPKGAVPVVLAGGTGEALSRPTPATVSYPLGRRTGVVLAEPRRGLSGLRFDVRCFTLDEADRVQTLIGSELVNLTPVVCVRLGGDEQRLRVPQPLFLGVLDIVEVSMNVFWGGGDTLQNMVGDEVDPPIPGLFVPLLTAADINVSFATASALNAAHATAAAVNRRYDLAGAAAT